VKAVRLRTAHAVGSWPVASGDAPRRATGRAREPGLAPHVPRSCLARAAPHPTARALPGSRWPQPARFELRRIPRSCRTPAADPDRSQSTSEVPARCFARHLGLTGTQPSASRLGPATTSDLHADAIWYLCNIIFAGKHLQPSCWRETGHDPAFFQSSILRTWICVILLRKRCFCRDSRETGLRTDNTSNRRCASAFPCDRGARPAPAGVPNVEPQH